MAKKQDRAAERQRKQKIFLAVAGVAFLGLVAIQVPKLLKQVKGSSSPAPVTQSSSGTTPTPASTPATGGAAPTQSTTAPANAPKGSTAQLAGVVIVNEQPAKATQGQLDSFSMFESKDPFVQKVDPNAHPDGGASAPTTSEPTSSGSGDATKGGSTPPTGSTPTGGPLTDGSGSAGPTTPSTTPPAAPNAAMLRINGALQLVALKARFPKVDRTFVLRKLNRKGTAVIAVAGGNFSKGATLELKLGKPVTLVNTATGARYVVRLVWLGSDASQVARFTADAK